ncbi:Uu.00g044970.m01.CDS01 [Anthostomella pinea]|uniref:Uu.00g044970.m01.CDS01 n=1 Tax=Anthostomella pinea TaxID=933095 RepID=A0AAI8YBY8_9PEZI|nr:Uu.00g044970.m01.CDS01 [Anthostomella pinea]
MTPLNLISFLLSLYLIEDHYQAQRSQGHTISSPSSRSRSSSSASSNGKSAFELRYPSWLHRLLFRPQPYEWVENQRKPAPPNRDDERWYYHVYKRKVMRMEATDAFELRNTVLLGLCLLAVGGVWALWGVGRGVWGCVRAGL